MIRKVRGGYAVYSHRTGRKLSRNYRSKKAATKRLRQIQWFKNHPR